MTLKPLTVLRSDDREVMAQQVEAIAGAMGALCARARGDARSAACIALRIVAPGGLSVHLSLDGEAGRLHTLHFLHWSLDSGSVHRLHPRFGGVNARHFAQATHVAYSFLGLCEQLELCLRLAASGDAFQPRRRPVRQLVGAR